MCNLLIETWRGIYGGVIKCHAAVLCVSMRGKSFPLVVVQHFDAHWFPIGHRRAFTISSLRYIISAYISYLELDATAQAYLCLIDRRGSVHRTMFTTVRKGMKHKSCISSEHLPNHWLKTSQQNGLAAYYPLTKRFQGLMDAREDMITALNLNIPIFHAIRFFYLHDLDSFHPRSRVSSQA